MIDLIEELARMKARSVPFVAVQTADQSTTSTKIQKWINGE